MARKRIIIGIYLIENQINHKKYVGQSKNILARWCGHRCDSKIKDLPLYRAMRKYGINNFTFSILEECKISELSIKEDYWINYYNCFVPNGYNYNKAETHYTNIAIPEKYRHIINEIKYSDKLLKEIAQEYELSISSITEINQGTRWRLEGEQYPLRGHNDLSLELIIALLKEEFTIKEIADYLMVTVPVIKGFLYTRNIKVTDIRQSLTSSRRIIITDLSTNIQYAFRKKIEAAQWLHEKEHLTININSVVCAFTNHLKTGKPYKNYIIAYDDINIINTIDDYNNLINMEG